MRALAAPTARLLLPLLAALLITAGFWPDAASATPPATGGPSAVSPMSPPPAITKDHPKLNGRIAARLRARASRSIQGLLPPVLSLARTAAETVRAVAEPLPGRVQAARREIERQGGTVEIVTGGQVQFTASLDMIERLAASGDIRVLREPYRAFTGAVTGEGVGVTGATAWHLAGYTGRGVKIGVLDAGFAGYESRLGNELPAAVTVRSVRADGDITGGGEVHGTAVAEIVHEMAPDADLVLVNYSSDMDFAAGVSYLQSQQVKVITNSTGSFVWGPGDGSGPVNQTVTAAVQSGIVWSQAAGNHARRHWSGNYSDSNGDGWNNFSPSANVNPLSVSQGNFIEVQLKWNDPFGASCTDYDVYLLDPDLRVIDDFFARSVGAQDCSQDPVEIIVYQAPRSGDYSIGITRWDDDGVPGPNPNAKLDLYSVAHNLFHWTAANSLTIPGDNALATTVGAHVYSQPASVEAFSSQGPTADGRAKPDLAAPDGVSSATYGGFFGTSAATPHVGAAAALVQQAHPEYTAAQVKAFLKGRAVDILAPGEDNVAGAGRLSLGAAPLAIDPATALVTAPVAAPADGTTAVPVTVAVRDTAGAPAVGQPVALTSPRGATDRITPAVALTDAQGTAAFSIMSNIPGTVAFSLRALAENAALGTAPVVFVGGTRSLTVTPPSGPPRREVTLNGAGFAPNLNVELRWGADETLITFARANAAGAFTALVTPPAGAPGPNPVRAVQGLLAAASSYTVFNPALAAVPNAGTAGAGLTLTGVDFYPLLPVTFRLDGTSDLGNAAASSAGRVTLAATVPAVAGGNHLIEAVQEGAETLRATAAFTVILTPALTGVTPSTTGQGAVGRNLTLHGSGFGGGMTVSVGGVGVTVSSTSVSSETVAVATLDVAPDAPTGLRDLTVRNADGGTATQPGALTVTQGPSIAHVPVTGGLGEDTNRNVVITGTGFAADAAVEISGSGVHFINAVVTPPGQIAGDIQFSRDAALGPRDLTVLNPDGGRTMAHGVVRVLGQLTAVQVVAPQTGRLEVSFTTVQAVPSGGSIEVTPMAAGASAAQVAAPALTVNGSPCAGATLLPSAWSVNVRPGAGCPIAAGQPVTLGLVALVLPAPPAFVMVHVQTLDATARGLDTAVARLFQPLLAAVPPVAAPGETVAVSGRGFPELTGITVPPSEVSGADLGAVSAADGGFTLAFAVPADVEAGFHELTAAAGLVRATARLIVTSPPALTVAPPAGSPTGPFTLSGAGFVPDEAVTVQWDAGTPVALPATAADSAGGLRLALSPPATTVPGPARITVTGASGRTASTAYSVTSTSAALRGRVVARGGSGIAGAKGWANAAGLGDSGPFSVAWTSDDTGDFTAAVPPGAYNVGVFVDGRAVLTPEQTVSILPDGSQRPAAPVFEVAAGDQRVSGQVVSGSGADDTPVNGALVTATGIPVAAGGGQLLARTRTGADGLFRFALPSSHNWTVSPTLDGIPALLTAESQPLPSDADPPRRYRLAATVTLTGQLLRGGSPAGGVPLAADGPARVNGASDATGTYRLTLPLIGSVSGVTTYWLTAGSSETGYARFELDVNAAGVAACRTSTNGVTCPAPGVPGAGPDIVLPGGGIRIRLTGPDGVLPAALVGLHARAVNDGHSHTASSRTGTGLVLLLPAGEYDLEVSVPGLVQQHFARVASPGEVTVPLPQTVTLCGAVQDGTGETSGATIVLQSVTDPRSVRTALSGGPGVAPDCVTGSFGVSVPVNGSYRVWAAQAGYLASAPQTVPVTTDAPSPVTLTLTPLAGAATVAGSITGVGAGAAVTVTATLPDGRTVTAARGAWPDGCAPPADGYCLRLPPGTWRLSATAQDFAATTPGPAVTVPDSGPAPTGPTLALVARAATTDAPSSAPVLAEAGSLTAGSNGLTIDVPPGALPGVGGTVSVSSRTVAEVAGAGNLYVAGGRAVQLDLRDDAGRRLTSFARPLAITLSYGDLMAAGQLTAAAAARLACARFDTAVGLWLPLSGVNDAGRRTLTCFTDRLTKITALSDTPPPVPAPAQTSGGSSSGGGGGSPAAVTPTPAATPTPLPTSAVTALAADGSGALSVQNVAISLPAGSAHDAARRASVELVELGPAGSVQSAATVADPQTRFPDGMIAGTTAFRLAVQDAAGAALVEFTTPVALSVRYRDEDVRRAGIDATRLSLARWDAGKAAWTLLATAADASTARLLAQADRPGLFAVLASVPRPAITGPAAGSVSVEMAPSLRWNVPAGTLWHQLQVIPYGNDGPGINLLIGDPAQVAAGRFDVPPPRAGHGDYILLPGMTYTWRVRVSPAPWPISEQDGGWSVWSAGSFRTGAASPAGIALVSPASNAVTASRTPTLRWNNANGRVYYYEVQLSQDPDFEADPAQAVAAVYWNLVHGGISQPPNSWTVPADYPLEGGAAYSWRVRPRVQGDGTPVEWSTAGTFRTP